MLWEVLVSSRPSNMNRLVSLESLLLVGARLSEISVSLKVSPKVVRQDIAKLTAAGSDACYSPLSYRWYCRRAIFSANLRSVASSVATGPHRDFQLAGELYGRLRLAFAFGELMMFSSAWGGGRIPTGVSYRWVFNVDGSSYGIEHFVSFVDLVASLSVEAHADRLIAEWTAEHERLSLVSKNGE